MGQERMGRDGLEWACPSNEGHAAKALERVSLLHGKERTGAEGIGTDGSGLAWAFYFLRNSFDFSICCAIL